MGSRGASSGRGASGLKQTGLKVTMPDGEKVEYIFTKKGKSNFYQRGVGGTPEPTPRNMDAKEFKTRIQKNGGTVNKMSNKQMNAKVKEAEETRKQVRDELYGGRTTDGASSKRYKRSARARANKNYTI